jgi:hypothetical protein
MREDRPIYASQVTCRLTSDPVMTGSTICQNTSSSSQVSGTWTDGGSNDICCPGDTNGNGVVNIEDLLNMMGSWGACP